MSKQLLMVAAAALTLAACSDNDPAAPAAKAAAAPKAVTVPAPPQWSIFTTQTPDAVVDVTDNPGWEVATRFHSSKAGNVIGLRFWRATAETGTTTAKLWTDGGSKLASVPLPSGTGWQSARLPTPYHIAANTNYRVSANINTVQEKSFSTFLNGPVTNGPLTADFSYYGQPANAMPTQGSYSNFYVDVIFQEDLLAPNLTIGNLAVGGTDAFGNGLVSSSVCNFGTATAGASTMEYVHAVTPIGGGTTSRTYSYLNLPSIAVGVCLPFSYQDTSPLGTNTYTMIADYNDKVNETSEADNSLSTSWYRAY